MHEMWDYSRGSVYAYVRCVCRVLKGQLSKALAVPKRQKCVLVCNQTAQLHYLHNDFHTHNEQCM